MRVMKTWEMIKELTENPEKEFVDKNNEDYHVFIDVRGDISYGIMGDGAVRKFQLTGNNLDKIWEEVKEPVDFMTAIKSGKHIGVEYSGAKYKEMSLPNLFYELQQDYSHETIRQFILYGKWYIEED